MMKPACILLVEDEEAIQSMVSFSLRQAGYQIQVASSAEQSLLMIQETLPDVLLLDWMLPKMSGIELARRLRADRRTQALPIIMLTARTDERDKVLGLDTGADDYLTKPFSPRELQARINAVLRRLAPQSTEAMVCVGALTLDPSTHRVTSGETVLSIGPTEFRLLHFLMTHPERVYSRTQLLNYIWGDHVFIEERTVDVHIRRLRLALEPAKQHHLVQTVRGTGYRLSIHAEVD